MKTFHQLVNVWFQTEAIQMVKTDGDLPFSHQQITIAASLLSSLAIFLFDWPVIPSFVCALLLVAGQIMILIHVATKHMRTLIDTMGNTAWWDA